MKWVIVAWWLLVIAMMVEQKCYPHESEEYKHQTERIMRYGQGDKGLGIQFWYVNKERTLCIDTVFNHGIMHVTQPYKCGD